MKGWVRTNRYYDHRLFRIIVVLAAFGLMMVLSSSSYAAAKKLNDSLYYFKRQGMILAGGIAVMVIVSHLDYHRWFSLVLWAYVGAVVLMVLVNYTPFGVELNGKTYAKGYIEHKDIAAGGTLTIKMGQDKKIWY